MPPGDWYRARQVLQYSDEELADKRGYDLIHPDDCSYYAAAHQERTLPGLLYIAAIITIFIYMIFIYLFIES